MVNFSKRLLLVVAALLLATLACQALTGGKSESIGVTITQDPLAVPTETPAGPAVEPTSAAPEAEEQPENDTPKKLDSPFPLPPDVESIDTLGDEHINFQTGMSIDEVIAFYRDELGALGLAERDLLTVISENAFSMVFDGAPNGMAMVIQGVYLAPGSLNINIRYEDI